MGGGRWSDTDWTKYATTRSYDTKTVTEIYDTKKLHADLNPHGIKTRESRDSEDNQNSTPVIVALDVTGSMGMVLSTMAKKGLNTLVTEIYNRKPVSDPHIMCMGVGDVKYDSAPLQTTQFEADIRIAEQLEKIYFERGGGGNDSESYSLAWYFAGMHTSTDCFEKRNKKGYLFTIGDEMPPPDLHPDEIEKVLGYGPQGPVATQEALAMACRMYHVYHIIIAEGHFASVHMDRTVNAWSDLLGQNAIVVNDHNKIAEVIVSTIQLNEGHDAETVINSWDGSTSLVVREAIKSLTPVSKSTDVVAL